MRFLPFSIIAGIAVATAVGTYRLTGGQIRFGAPRPATRPALSGQGPAPETGYRITGGSLAWNPEWNDETRIIARNGTRHTLDSVNGAFAAYELVAEQLVVANKMHELANRAIPAELGEQVLAGWRRNGVYDLSGLDELQLAIVTQWVNGMIQFGQGLRCLSRLYRMNNLDVGDKGRTFAGTGFGLENIIMTGGLNPLAVRVAGGTLTRAEVVESVQTPAQWAGLGMRIVVEFQRAFPNVVALSSEDERALGADFAEEVEELVAEGEQTMSGRRSNPLPVLFWVIVAVGTAAGIAVGLQTAIAGAMAFLGVNTRYQNQLSRQYEEAMECCLTGRERRGPFGLMRREVSEADQQNCCEQAEALAERIEDYNAGLAKRFRFLITAGSVVVVTLGGLAILRMLPQSKRRKPRQIRSSARQRKLLPA